MVAVTELDGKDLPMREEDSGECGASRGPPDSAPPPTDSGKPPEDPALSHYRGLPRVPGEEPEPVRMG